MIILVMYLRLGKKEADRYNSVFAENTQHVLGLCHGGFVTRMHCGQMVEIF